MLERLVIMITLRLLISGLLISGSGFPAANLLLVYQDVESGHLISISGQINHVLHQVRGRIKKLAQSNLQFRSCPVRN